MWINTRVTLRKLFVLFGLLIFIIPSSEAQSRRKKKNKVEAQNGFIFGIDEVFYGAYPFNYTNNTFNIGFIKTYEKLIIKSFVGILNRDTQSNWSEFNYIDYKIRQYYFKLQFDYNLLKFLSIGYHVKPTYGLLDRIPFNHRNEYQTKDLEYKVGVGLDPAFFYKWKHFYMTLGLELPLYEFGHYRYQELNPLLPAPQQYDISNEFRFLEKEWKYYFMVAYLF